MDGAAGEAGPWDEDEGPAVEEPALSEELRRDDWALIAW